MDSKTITQIETLFLYCNDERNIALQNIHRLSIGFCCLYRAAGGKISDIPPESKRSLDLELSRLEKQYKAEGVDMTKFPNFQFQGLYYYY